MIFIYLSAALILLYVIFAAAPAIVSFFMVFGRKQGPDPDEIDPKNSYFAPYLPEMREAAAFLKAQNPTAVCMRAPDGVRLSADWYHSGSDTLAICMHGFRSTPLTSFGVLGRELKNMGCDLLLVRERAHGNSEGKHSTLGILESGDLLAWISWAETHTGAKNILLCGVSMGAAAVALASDKITSDKVRAMIIDCGFASAYEQISTDCRKWHLPDKLMVPVISLCAKIVLHINLKTSACDSLSRTQIPALFLHGTADTSVLLQQGTRCYAACASEKEQIVVEGAQHTVSLMRGGEEVKERVRAFVRKHVKY